MRSPRTAAIAAALVLLAAGAVAAAWLEQWALAVTGLALLTALGAGLALWAVVRVGHVGRTLSRRLEKTDKVLEKSLTDAVLPALERLETATQAAGEQAAEALEALRQAAIRQPGEVVMDTHEVIGILRALQAQHLGRLDRAQDALEAAIARLDQRTH